MQIIRKIKSGFDSPEDVLLFLRIFMFATVLPLLVRFLSIPKLMNIITPGTPVPGVKCDDIARKKIEKYTDYILGTNFWIYNSTCLKRSLIMYSFLRKYGMNVRLCFGVKYKKEMSVGLEGNQLDGHAWLLYNGDIYLEKNIQVTKTYIMTYCYPEISDDMNEKVLIAAIEGFE